MKIKKLTAGLILAAAISFLWGQSNSKNQVRDFICVVKPHFEQDKVELLKSIRDNKELKSYLNKKNINDLLEIKEDSESSKNKKSAEEDAQSETDNDSSEEDIQVIEDGDYMGFIYVDSRTKKNYVVTSRQALLYCDTADIIIRNSQTRTEKAYKNLKRIAISDKYNIGILELNENLFETSMPIYSGTLSDGDDIYIATYEKDDDTREYEWLFEKNSVTNNDAKSDEEYKVFSIQYWSSNPYYAFVRDSSSSMNYSLAGISNGGKKSIYIQEITDAISKMISSENNMSDSEKAVQKLIKGLSENNGYSIINPLISKNSIYAFSPKMFVKIADEAPSIADVKYNFRRNPFEGYRSAIAYEIWYKYYSSAKLKNLKSSDIQKTDETHFSVKISDSYGNNVLDTVWVLEDRNWHLDSICLTPESKKYSVEKDEAKMFKKTTSKVFYQEDYALRGTTISYGTNIPVLAATSEKTSKNPVENNVLTGFHFSMETTSAFKGWGGMGFSFDVIPSDQDVLRTISFDALARIPITFEYVAFAPKIKGGVMWNIFSDSYAWGAYYEAGLDCYINDNWGVGSTFKQQFIFPLVESTCRYNIMGVSVYMIFSAN